MPFQTIYVYEKKRIWVEVIKCVIISLNGMKVKKRMTFFTSKEMKIKENVNDL
jgi:hypothetical protein